MAFERKKDSGGGEVFKFENPGDTLTGFYLGSEDHTGEFGPTKKHVFKTETGTKVCFGQTHLTQLLADEEPGYLMIVTFDSTKKTGRGKPMKVFTLDIDKDQKAAGVEAASFEDEPIEDDIPADEVKTAPAKSYPTPAAVDPAARARIQAELAKRKNSAKTA